MGSDHLISGAIAGLSNCIILQPFDLRLQSSKLSATDVIRNIYSKESLAGFWKGTSPTILRNVPGTALYFYFLDSFLWGMRFLKPNISQEFSNFFAGASARIAAGTILMPVTVIKTRFEANARSNATIFGTASDIIKSQGIRGLFSGLIATTFRDAPYAGIYVVFYSNFKEYLNPHYPGTISNAIAGALSGTASTIITQPFDVVKTKMQLDPILNRGFIKTFIRIAKNEGFVGYFSGIGPRLARKPLQSMITWIVYEEVLKLNV